MLIGTESRHEEKGEGMGEEKFFRVAKKWHTTNPYGKCPQTPNRQQVGGPQQPQTRYHGPISLVCVERDGRGREGAVAPQKRGHNCYEEIFLKQANESIARLNSNAWPLPSF